MIQADSEYITPPKNTPVDTMRRRFLAVAGFKRQLALAAFSTISTASYMTSRSGRLLEMLDDLKVCYSAKEFPI